jgi:ketosteroid isomerase-like protein
MATSAEIHPSAGPDATLQRLQAAQNQHDLEALVDCFAPDYESEQPLHPGTAFRGRDQVRKNWATILAAVPDFQPEFLSYAKRDNTVWAEWHWHGARADGKRLAMRGVTLFGVQNDRIVWGRLYMEPEESDTGIDAQVRSRTQA